MSTHNNKTILGWVLVFAQFSLIAILVWQIFLAGYPDSLLAGSAAAILLGMGIALFIFTQYFNRPGNWSIHPHPKDGGNLVTQGPYQLIRHPMYSAALLSALGASLWVPNALSLLCTFALLIVFVLKIEIEEREMARKFLGWADYAASTKRLIPNVW